MSHIFHIFTEFFKDNFTKYVFLNDYAVLITKMSDVDFRGVASYNGIASFSGNAAHYVNSLARDV